MNGIILIGFLILLIMCYGMIKLIGSMFAVVKESSTFYLKLLYFRFFSLLSLLAFVGIFFLFIKSQSIDKINFASSKIHVSEKVVSLKTGTKKEEVKVKMLNNQFLEVGHMIYKMVEVGKLVTNGQFSKMEYKGKEYYLIPKKKKASLP